MSRGQPSRGLEGERGRWGVARVAVTGAGGGEGPVGCRAGSRHGGRRGRGAGGVSRGQPSRGPEGERGRWGVARAAVTGAGGG